jgi:hypothetical protein
MPSEGVCMAIGGLFIGWGKVRYTLERKRLSGRVQNHLISILSHEILLKVV